MSEPIAIVGMGCRFGQIETLNDFWKLLLEGRSALGPIPADRFSLEQLYDAQPGTRGKVISREGAYFRNVKDFDARFFRISPREAAAMDPQQRILLEVAWNAILDAGLTTEQLNGSRTGVYVGLFTSDFRERLVKLPDFDVDVYTEIGSTRSSTAGRVAYAFNLTGPTVALDAACASSLVAVHLACQSIWSGETRMALAAGTNVILEPDTTICFSRSKMLSPRSRCRFGDASADGFVRSDGVGVVVLKPLSDAIAAGDRIYSLIRATGVNNDARQGDGLFMTPSKEGQKQLLRTVYHGADLSLDKLAYVEAHGTGTRAGDPVECGAIADILGRPRQSTAPLLLGSVKTNIGHTEGAAGIAALIKTALSLYHRQLPPSLYLERPNPDIPWLEGRISIVTRNTDLPQDTSVLAGVSSFGLSGTNAHAVLETWTPGPGQTQQPPMSEANVPPLYVLPISAHSPEAMQAQVVQFHQVLGQLTSTAAASSPSAAPSTASGTEAADANALNTNTSPPDLQPDSPLSLTDVCYTAAVRRSPLGHRLAVVGSSPQALQEALAPLMTAPPETFPEARTARVVFICPGQGGQWAGMGAALYERAPAFRTAIDAIDRAFRQGEGWSILEAMHDPNAAWLKDIARVQPMLFAIQVGLGKLWEHYGIIPQAVIGHSLGEVAAAHLAGALSLDDAVLVIGLRSRALATIRGQGAMAVVGLDEDATLELLAGIEDQVTIAVSNSRASTVIAGNPDIISGLLEELTARGVYNNRVDVDVASHSPQTEPLLHGLRTGLARLSPRASVIPFYSTVTCDKEPGQALGPDYWASNMRQTVRFFETTRRLIREGFEVFVELGPHPVLLNPLSQTLREAGTGGLTVSTMRRDAPAQQTFFNSLAQLFGYGVPVQWRQLYPHGQHVPLPEYPFQRETFWLMDALVETASPAQARPGTPTAPTRKTRGGGQAHPLLPHHLRLGSTPEVSLWELPLSTPRFPYLADHKVKGSVLLPGAAFVEVALAAAAEHFGLDGDAQGRLALEGLQLLDYLVVPSQEERSLQVQLSLQTPTTAEVRFFSFEESGADERPPRFHAITLIRLLDPEPEELGPGESTDATTAPLLRPSADNLGHFLEQLQLERVQLKHTGLANAALLSVSVNPIGSSGEIAHPRQLARRLHRLLRHNDVIQPIGQGQFLVLLRRIRGPEVLRALTSRLSQRLLDGIDLIRASEKSLPTVLIQSSNLKGVLNSDSGILLPGSLTIPASMGLSPVLEGMGAPLQRLDGVIVSPALPGPEPAPLELRGLMLDMDQDPSTLLQRALTLDLPLLEGPSTPSDPAALSPEERVESNLDGSTFYQQMAQRGIDYGRPFQPVRRLVRQGLQSRAELEVPDSLLSSLNAHLLHPAVLDGCFQAAVGAFLPTRSGTEGGGTDDRGDETLLPVGLKRMTIHRRLTSQLHCHAWLKRPALGAAGQADAQGDARPDELEIDFEICDPQRQPLITVEGFRVRLFERQNIVLPQQSWKQWLHHWAWEAEIQAPANTRVLPPAPEGLWLILEESACLGEALEEQLKALGGRVMRLTLTDEEQVTCVHEAFVGPTLDAPSPLTAPHPWEQVLDLCLELARSRTQPFTANQPIAGLLYLCAPTLAPREGARLMACSIARSLRITQLARKLGEAAIRIPALHLVTTGAWSLSDPMRRPGAPPDPRGPGSSPQPVPLEGSQSPGQALDQAPLWGLGRVIASEKPEFALQLIDLSPTPGKEDLRILAHSLNTPDRVDEYAIRQGQRYIHRLQPGLPPASRPATRSQLVQGRSAVSLYLEPAMSDSRLDQHPTSRARPVWRSSPMAEASEGLPPLARGEVQVQLEAVVMAAGSLHHPEEALVGVAGTVLAVGPQCRNLKPGQRVITLLPLGVPPEEDPVLHPAGTPFQLLDCTPRLPAHQLLELPACLSLQQGATFAATFVLGWLGLNPWQNGHNVLKRHEKVLIQTAGTRAGMAAAWLAQLTRTRVVATAPRLEDRAQLRALGLPLVLDEQSTELKEQLAELTPPRGLDRVIGFGGMSHTVRTASQRRDARMSRASLANGRLLSLQGLLEPGGHLVAVGSAGLPASEDPTLQLSGSVSRLAPAELLKHRPERVWQALQRVMQFVLLPAQRSRFLAQFPLFEAEHVLAPHCLDALETCASSQPDALVCLDLEAPAIHIEAPLTQDSLYDARGSYWITGGAGGLGQLLAQHLARRGAGEIVLLSRSISGNSLATHPSLLALRETVAAAGTRLTVLQADVTDAASLLQAYQNRPAELWPVRGIFHLAGCLADGTLEHQTPESYEAVMQPKVQGAWNLHLLSRMLPPTHPLTHFVLFASAATTLGSPGQSNYAAANAFLDALAQYRVQQGLPALSLDWGTWAEAGLAIEKEDRAARLESRGLDAMGTSEALQAMEAAMLQGSTPSVAIFAIDWARWSKAFPRVARVESTAGRVPVVATTLDESKATILERLNAHPDNRRTLLEGFVRQQLAEVLRMPPARLTLTVPMAQLGMDSLMTVELRSRLREHLKVELSPSRILSMVNPGALLDALQEILFPSRNTNAGTSTPSATESEEKRPQMPRVHLDSWIKTGTVAAPVLAPRHAFLTGATGFLGAYVLRSLLDKTQAQISCLVRAADAELGRARLRENLETYQLWQEGDEDRIRIVVGDLEKPLLGLSKVAFRQLAEAIDVIYHCAAWVNHLYPYERLAPINVKGTQEILRLAVISETLPVHYVSTIAVFPFSLDPTRDWTIDETTPLENTTEPFFAGYSQSKWVAERMIERARARGLNVCIYRPGAITGSRQTGQCPESDTIWRVVQSAVKGGVVPRTIASIGLTPVDAVANAMVELACQESAVNQTYHLFGDAPMLLSNVVSCLESMGYGIRTLSFEGWRRRMQAEGEQNPVMAALMPRLLELDLERLDRSRIQTSAAKSLARLSPEARQALTVDSTLLRKYLEVMRQSGFLPPPVRTFRLPTRLTNPGLQPVVENSAA